MTDAAAPRSAPAMQSVQTVTGGVRAGRPRGHADARAPDDRLARLGGRGAARSRDPARACPALHRPPGRAPRRSACGTMVDPCPIDLGRDVDFMAEVAQQSRVRIVCATGLYKEDTGRAGLLQVPAAVRRRARRDDRRLRARAHRRHRRHRASAPGSSRWPPVRVASRRTRRWCCAPRRAHTRRPACRSPPTPTRARWVPSSWTILAAEGVAPSSVIIGHSCGSSDLSLPSAHARSRRLPGLRSLRPRDPASRSRAAGGADRAPRRRLRAPARAVARHGVVLARPRAHVAARDAAATGSRRYVLRKVVPRLRDAGVDEAKIQAMLVDNPRRYFAEAGTTTC